MSDDPVNLTDAGLQERPRGIYEHGCEHPGCQKWGGYGFSRNKLQAPRWYCYEHKIDGEALIG